MRGVLISVVLLGGALALPAAGADAGPRAGCFAVTDPRNDTLIAFVAPAAGDPALDVIGGNLRVTPTTITTYLSVAKLSSPPTAAGTPATWYEMSLSVGIRTVSMWVDDFGTTQPAREALGQAWAGVYAATKLYPEDRYLRTSQGARFEDGTPAGKPLAVSVAKDLNRSYVSWTFNRKVLERALAAKFDRSLRVSLGGEADQSDASLDLGFTYDPMAASSFRVGARNCF